MSKAAEILETSATITERGQTTMPAAVRKILGLSKRGRVVFPGAGGQDRGDHEGGRGPIGR
jgi:antitoxin PrlF